MCKGPPKASKRESNDHSRSVASIVIHLFALPHGLCTWLFCLWEFPRGDLLDQGLNMSHILEQILTIEPLGVSTQI